MLKSGASMPTNTSGRSSPKRRVRSADLQQAWQALKHFHHAHDRQLFHFVPGFAPFGLHQRAGDANETRVGDLRLERADQTGAENVTGGFSGDQSDSQWTIRHNSANDATGGTGEEIEVQLHHRLLFGQGFDFRFRFIQRFSLRYRIL